MKEIGILFKPDMIRAILAGRKSQTRRIIKPQPDDSHHWRIFKDYKMAVHLLDTTKGLVAKFSDCANGNAEENICVTCRYGQPGDLLYVKEAWTEWPKGELQYRASTPAGEELGKWKSPLFLKKEDARIWLENTGVRVERLQDISDMDAIGEGIESVAKDTVHRYRDYSRISNPMVMAICDFPRESFKTLIQSIHGPEVWDNNPWVWKIEFEVLSTNGRP